MEGDGDVQSQLVGLHRTGVVLEAWDDPRRVCPSGVSPPGLASCCSSPHRRRGWGRRSGRAPAAVPAAVGRCSWPRTASRWPGCGVPVVLLASGFTTSLMRGLPSLETWYHAPARTATGVAVGVGLEDAAPSACSHCPDTYGRRGVHHSRRGPVRCWSARLSGPGWLSSGR